MRRVFSTDNMVFLIWVPFSLPFLLSSLVSRLLEWDAGRTRLLQVSVYESVCISLSSLYILSPLLKAISKRRSAGGNIFYHCYYEWL